ncbi:competence type IV pilus major pilin ComGC [Alkalibacterium sp. f15]|uniref:competence type IV pilus major pilin ComGC n=1 Tax=Alkalibacterium sp. f15 TaxID=3414029 RepID=UPI003BF92625
MRKKIKELMNREEGFTLVELLAVIVILGIIVAIAVPMIGNVISRAQTGATTAEQELVVDAARLYTVENAVANGTKLEVSTLITAGYLEETSSTNISADDHVYITLVNGNYTYEFDGPSGP